MNEPTTPPSTSSIAERYRRAAAGFTARVAATPPDRWSAASPCPGWSARDVVRHVVESHAMFRGFVGRETTGIPTVDDDPLAAWTASRDLVQAELDDPTAAAAEFDGFSGRTTFAEAVDRFLVFDLHVHGWDLARATGLPDRIDPEEVPRLLAAAESFGDAMRGPGAFGPAVEPPAGADAQDRLLAFLGRQP